MLVTHVAACARRWPGRCRVPADRVPTGLCADAAWRRPWQGRQGPRVPGPRGLHRAHLQAWRHPRSVPGIWRLCAGAGAFPAHDLGAWDLSVGQVFDQYMGGLCVPATMWPCSHMCLWPFAYQAWTQARAYSGMATAGYCSCDILPVAPRRPACMNRQHMTGASQRWCTSRQRLIMSL